MDKARKILLSFIYALARKLFGGMGLRKIGFVAAAHRFVVSRIRPDFVDVGGLKLYLDVVEGIEVEEGVHEKETTGIFKSEIKEGDVVLDVGADIGYFACLAAKLVGDTGKIYAFEPNPNSLKYLKKNVGVNNLRNVIVVPNAVSDKRGAEKFFMHGPHSSFGYDRFSDKENFSTIESITLDDFFGTNSARVNFVKIDVEGSEAKALRGMERLLRANKGVKIVMEFYPLLLKMAGEDAIAPLNFLASLGFKIYDMNNGGTGKSVSPDMLVKKYPVRDGAMTNLYCTR